MATEIERKFLVADLAGAVGEAESATHIRQGYLSANPDATVRVRLLGDRAFLTVKSRNHGCERGEWEYEIPAADGPELLALCGPAVIDKTRYVVPFGGHKWEVDVFAAPARPALAEVELSAAHEEVLLPPWVGEEVTGNPDYYNSSIATMK